MAQSRASWLRHPAVGTIIGIVCAIATILLIQRIGQALLGAEATSPGHTTAQFAIVFIAWLLGAAVGAFVATRWARTKSLIPGLIVGSFVLAGAAVTFTAILHPDWMVLGSVLLPIVGIAVAAVTRSVPRTGRPRAARG